MSGFTKLVPEIIQSSVWNEAAEIRCVWIAMIATKDANGYVRGDARTIARMANVEQDSAAIALAMFQEPDPASHTPDNDGRRIMAAPGGWIVLNHDLYRASDDVYREQTKARVRKYREKLNNQEDVTLQGTLPTRYPSASPSVSASDSASKKGESEGKTQPKQDAAFETFWNEYNKKEDKGHARPAFAKALKKASLEVMLAAIAEQHRTEKWKSGFQPNPATWLNGEQWENDPKSMNRIATSAITQVKYDY